MQLSCVRGIKWFPLFRNGHKIIFSQSSPTGIIFGMRHRGFPSGSTFWFLSGCRMLNSQICHFLQTLLFEYYRSDSVQICYGAWGRWVPLRFCSSSGSARSQCLWTIYSSIWYFLQKSYCQKVTGSKRWNCYSVSSILLKEETTAELFKSIGCIFSKFRICVHHSHIF